MNSNESFLLRYTQWLKSRRIAQKSSDSIRHVMLNERGLALFVDRETNPPRLQFVFEIKAQFSHLQLWHKFAFNCKPSQLCHRKSQWKQDEILNPAKHLLMTQRQRKRRGKEEKEVSDNLLLQWTLFLVSMETLELNCLGRNPNNFLPHKSILSRRRKKTERRKRN